MHCNRGQIFAPLAQSLLKHADGAGSFAISSRGRAGHGHHVSSHKLAGLFPGAEIVDNFTITGNSLGDQQWSGYIPVTMTAKNGSIVNTGAYGYNNGSW